MQLTLSNLSEILLKLNQIKILKLIREGYLILKNKNENYENIDNLIITEKGIELLKGNINYKETDSCENWINEYRDLFKNINKTRVGDKKDCIRKMNKFLKEYNTTKKEVLEATNYYINHLESSLYIKDASNFIYYNFEKPNETSPLSTYLEQIGENVDKWYDNII